MQKLTPTLTLILIILLTIATLSSCATLQDFSFESIAKDLATYIAAINCPNEDDVKTCLIILANAWIDENVVPRYGNAVAALFRTLVNEWALEWDNDSIIVVNGQWQYSNTTLMAYGATDKVEHMMSVARQMNE